MPQSVAFAFCHDDMVYVSIIGICVDGVFDGLCCIMERLFSVAWGRCWEMIVYRTIRYMIGIRAHDHSFLHTQRFGRVSA